MVGGNRRAGAMRRDRESVLRGEVSGDTACSGTVGRLELVVVGEDGCEVVFFSQRSSDGRREYCTLGLVEDTGEIEQEGDSSWLYSVVVEGDRSESLYVLCRETAGEPQRRIVENSRRNKTEEGLKLAVFSGGGRGRDAGRLATDRRGIG